MHTLNATALAVPRVIMAILENYWNEDKKTVEIPEQLKPWVPFEEIKERRFGVTINDKAE